jgi:hypothetical protein
MLVAMGSRPWSWGLSMSPGPARNLSREQHSAQVNWNRVTYGEHRESLSICHLIAKERGQWPVYTTRGKIRWPTYLYITDLDTPFIIFPHHTK